jgi:two-component system response regulator PilR (NtrC family)
VLAATNQDLEQMVRDRRFREDLYYRINVIQIRMPALREKPEDVPRLALHFLVKYGRVMGKKITRISEEAMRRLAEHNWPGNVRELENVIERAVALENSDAVTTESLSRDVRGGARLSPEFPVSLSDVGIDLERQLERLREHFMEEALRRAHGVQTKAAELLGMSFRSFRYFAKKYNLLDGRREPRASVG